MLNGESVVFMLDVDNTLLDKRFAADLTARLDRDFGFFGAAAGRATDTDRHRKSEAPHQEQA